MEAEKPYYRLSRSQATERAVAIAQEFLGAQKSQWEWNVVGASPADSPGKRKVVRHWVALVAWRSQDGGTIDGGPMVSVVLATREAQIYDPFAP